MIRFRTASWPHSAGKILRALPIAACSGRDRRRFSLFRCRPLESAFVWLAALPEIFTDWHFYDAEEKTIIMHRTDKNHLQTLIQRSTN